MPCSGLLERLNALNRERLHAESLKALAKEANDELRLELVCDVLKLLNGDEA